jgi:hypothetical protein
MKTAHTRQPVLFQPALSTDMLGATLAAIIQQLQAQGRVGPVLPEATIQLAKLPEKRFQAKRGPKPKSHAGSASVGS